MPESSAAEAAQVVFGGVFGSVDDAKAFAPAAFDSGLGDLPLGAVRV